MRLARIRLEERTTKGLERLILNWDADTDPALGGNEQSFRQSLLHLARGFEETARYNADREIALSSPDGACTLSVVVWRASDGDTPGVPAVETLERLACASIVAAYPERARGIQEWLDRRANAPPAGPKELAWSHMAGWYAKQGCEAFLRQLWLDPAIASELKARMNHIGAWQAIQRLL